MSSSKKRKLGAPAEKGLVSAFAARRNLWAPKAEPTNSSPATTGLNDRPRSQEPVAKVRLASTRGSVPAAEAEALPLATSPDGPRGGSAVPTPTSSTAASPWATDEQTPEKPPATPGPVVQHSSFRPDKHNCHRQSNGRTILKLEDGERLVLLGSYGLRVREGEVTVAGASLWPDDPVQWVHAPLCHALPVLRTTEATTVELSPHPDADGLRALEKLSPVFGKLWNEKTEKQRRGHQDTFQIIYTSQDGPKRAVLQDLVSPAEWNKKIAELAATKAARPPVVFVCGPKSAGKSTFGKLLGNRLVTSRRGDKARWRGIAVLDLDPGQPEYSAPGVVSLVHLSRPTLSPPFCHPHLAPDSGGRTVRAHAIASASPALDPEHYVECALDLFWRYREELGAETPLVVNTPGWIQGTGLDVLAALVGKMRPGEVVYMSRDGPDETVEALTAACAAATVPLSLLPSRAGGDGSNPKSALHYRTMQAMSYFHWGGDGSGKTSPPSRWDPRPLAEQPPWRVRFRGADRGFLAVLFYDDQPPPDLLAEAINGTVVGLAAVDNRAALRGLLPLGAHDGGGTGSDGDTQMGTAGLENEMPRTPDGIPFLPNPDGQTLDPRHSRLVALALVRGIDVRRGELQMLVPLSDDAAAELSGVGRDLVLVAGKFDTPCWAYAEDLYKQRSSTGAGGDDTDEDEEEEDDNGGSSSSREDRQESTRPAGPRRFEGPWVELLHGSQKRTVGSRAWRVRRDLGKGQ